MKVTNVKINKNMKDGSKAKAIVDIVLDGEFAVHGIRIIESKDRLFLAMPSRKMKDGKFKDISNPITQSCRQKIEDAVLAEFNK